MERLDKNLSRKIQYTGFIMTCLMVFYHCSVFVTPVACGRLDGMLSSLLIYDFTALGKLVMSWFFTVTGFLLFRDLTFGNYFQKIKRRVFSLLIPYMVWQCITAAVYVCAGKELTFAEFIKNTFALERWPVNGALWYIYVVFLMALLSPILLLAFKNKNIGWISIVLLFLLEEYLSAKNYFPGFFTYGLIPNILYYLPSYLIGAFYGKFSDDATDHGTIPYGLSLLLIAFLLNGVFPGYTEAIAVQLIPMSILFFAPDIPMLHDKTIYDLSFLIYALHQPVIRFAEEILWRTELSVAIPATLWFICLRTAVLLCVIGIAAAIYFLLRKKGRFVLKLLTGGRA